MPVEPLFGPLIGLSFNSDDAVYDGTGTFSNRGTVTATADP